MITKSYIEGLKQRVELVKWALDERKGLDPIDQKAREYHTRQLLDYLEGLDYFVEEEKNVGDWEKEFDELELKDDFGASQHIYSNARNQIKDFIRQNFNLKNNKMRCEICKNPLYERQDGSLCCVEMHH